jgi:uncharacterized protein with HEPN domain
VPSRHDPLDCLADILENIERIEKYVAGLDRNAFERDGRTRDAVERCLERICEAAFRLGDAAPKLMPDQPWPDIRGVGNRLRHAYDRINLDVIWNAVRSDVPKLAADVRLALQRLQHDSGRPGI